MSHFNRTATALGVALDGEMPGVLMLSHNELEPYTSIRGGRAGGVDSTGDRAWFESGSVLGSDGDFYTVCPYTARWFESEGLVGLSGFNDDARMIGEMDYGDHVLSLRCLG